MTKKLTSPFWLRAKLFVTLIVAFVLQSNVAQAQVLYSYSGEIYGYGFPPNSTCYWQAPDVDDFLNPGFCVPGMQTPINTDAYGMIARQSAPFSFTPPCISGGNFSPSFYDPSFNFIPINTISFPAQLGENYEQYKEIDVCGGSPICFTALDMSGYIDDYTATQCDAASGGTSEIVYAVRIAKDPTATTPITDVTVQITGNTGILKVSMMDGLGSTAACLGIQTVAIPPISGCQTTQVTFPTTQAGDYQVYQIIIEGAGVFDVCFGGKTGTKQVAVPARPAVAASTTTFTGTRGNWGRGDASACGATNFKVSDKSYQLTLNGTPIPTGTSLTFNLSPAVNCLCIKQFLQNPTGMEGVKRMVYNFGPALTATPTSAACAAVLPNGATKTANYNTAGIWNLTAPTSVSPNSVIPASASGLVNSAHEWNFGSPNGRGDYNLPSGGTCLQYEFCFNIVATNNVPNDTKVVGVYYPDNAGLRGGTISTPASPAQPATTVTAQLGCNNSLAGPHCGPSAGIVTFNPDTAPISIDFEDPAALPITLLSFQATPNKKTVRLAWTTASEINNDYFTLERSSDGEHFAAIGNVKGSGNTSDLTKYTFVDAQPTNGINYYRLRQTDFDRKTTLSNILSVEMSRSNTQVAIYPNPTTGFVTLQNIADVQNITIFDVMGKQILATATNASSQIEIDLSAQPSGVYILKTDTGEMLKIVKQ